MTFLYVTHDQEEALTMSDHVAVFNQGRIEQIGTPTEIYEQPATEFVAGFVGTTNILERDGRRFSVRPERIELHSPATARAKPATIADAVFVGAFTRYLVDTVRRRATHSRPAVRRLAHRAGHAASTWAGGPRTRTRSKSPRKRPSGGPMRKGMWSALAVVAVLLAFPAAGVSKATRRNAEHDRVGGLLAAAVGEAVREGQRLHDPREVRAARPTRW